MMVAPDGWGDPFRMMLNTGLKATRVVVVVVVVGPPPTGDVVGGGLLPPLAIAAPPPTTAAPPATTATVAAVPRPATPKPAGTAGNTVTAALVTKGATSRSFLHSPSVSTTSASLSAVRLSTNFWS